MNSHLNEILEEIRELENKVQLELKRREEELKYKISEGKVIFEREISNSTRKSGFRCSSISLKPLFSQSCLHR